MADETEKASATNKQQQSLLTPMIVQYVVGLCCYRRNPDAVDVTIGDMVFDEAAEKERDVDVTVTLEEEDGTIRAFKGSEVKKESEPLDVTTVEQLCIKLKDMPKVTHRAIFSASGYTKGAISKAAAHGVELYAIRPLRDDEGFPKRLVRGFQSTLLYWIGFRWTLQMSEGTPSFKPLPDSTVLFSADGSIHKEFANLGMYRDKMAFRSTGILCSFEPAKTIERTFPCEPMTDYGDFEAGPAWPHTHTLDVSRDQVFLKLDGNLHKIDAVTISGKLQWQRRKKDLEYYIMERVPDGEAFASAAIAEWGQNDGRMCAFTTDPNASVMGIHRFQLTEKQRNSIRNLKIPLETKSKEKAG